MESYLLFFHTIKKPKVMGIFYIGVKTDASPLCFVFGSMEEYRLKFTAC